MEQHLLTPRLQPGDVLLDLRRLKRLYPKSTSGIYGEVKEGKFVAPVRIGPNRVAWIEREVLDHLNRVIGAKCAGQTAPGARA